MGQRNKTAQKLFSAALLNLFVRRWQGLTSACCLVPGMKMQPFQERSMRWWHLPLVMLVLARPPCPWSLRPRPSLALWGSSWGQCPRPEAMNPHWDACFFSACAVAKKLGSQHFLMPYVSHKNVSTLWMGPTQETKRLAAPQGLGLSRYLPTIIWLICASKSALSPKGRRMGRMLGEGSQHPDHHGAYFSYMFQVCRKT